MLCNISQNAMGQPGGTLPGPARGGTLARGVPWPEGYPGWGVPWPGGYLWGYPGGTLARGGTLAGGYPGWGVPWPGVPCWGGTHLGQHREYLLHGGRYASCVHAAGLSCFHIILLLAFNRVIFLTLHKGFPCPKCKYSIAQWANCNRLLW